MTMVLLVCINILGQQGLLVCISLVCISLVGNLELLIEKLLLLVCVNFLEY